MAIEYAYEIEPRDHVLGGGYRLRLLKGGEEIGGGVFPYGYFLSEVEDGDIIAANALAHDAAVAEGDAWIDDHRPIPPPVDDQDDDEDDAPR